MIKTHFNTSNSVFFENHFKMIDTNIENLQEAKVICLGERHDTEMHEKKNAWLIDCLYQPGDVVLVEGIDKQEYPILEDTQKQYVKKKITIRGWDSKINGLFLGV